MAPRLFLNALGQSLAIERRALQLQARAKAFRDGVLIEVLSSDERDVLGAALYGASPANRMHTLFGWEQKWFDRYLGEPDSDPILAGGIGAGRELEALLARGHSVVAFEPSEDLAAEAETRTNERVHRATFSDVIAMGDSVFGHKTYSAILLGWGSLSHVCDDTEAKLLFEGLGRLCPGGPIFCSFLSTTIRGRSSDRARDWGRAVGKKMRNIRGRPMLSGNDDVTFDPSVGFLRYWNPDHVAALLPSREFRYEAHPYPHAVFLPSTK